MPERLYKEAIADIQPGKTVIIGQEGDIPVLGRLRAQHAQLKKLDDNTHALTDGINGKPSCSGIAADAIKIIDGQPVVIQNGGQPLTPNEYGTFVERNIDGKTVIEVVSATQPTIVKSGDKVYVGNRPGLKHKVGDPFKFIIP